MDIEMNERIALMLCRARTSKGKSQEYMAKALGVSKKTIQNWEDGYSTPTLGKSSEWFKALGLQPMPYFLELMYPEFDVDSSSDDAAISEALHKAIDMRTPKEKRMLLFILYGDHGSSPSGILQLIVAHLYTPLRDRLNVAQNILTNYLIADSQKKLRSKDHVKPDVELLKKSIKQGYETVLNGKEDYTNI